MVCAMCKGGAAKPSVQGDHGTVLSAMRIQVWRCKSFVLFQPTLGVMHFRFCDKQSFWGIGNHQVSRRAWCRSSELPPTRAGLE